MTDASTSIPRRSLFGAIFSTVISALPVFLLSASAVQIGDSLRFTAAGLGWIVSLHYSGAALASVPLGRLAQRIGGLPVMRFGCMTMGSLLVLTSCVRSTTEMAALMFLMGAVSAGLQPATVRFLVHQVPVKRRGFAFGVNQAAVPIATLLGGASVPVVALTAGWRWGFVGAAVLAFGVSAFLPRAPINIRTSRTRSRAPQVEPLGVHTRRSLILLSCGFGMGVAAANSLSTFTVTAAVAGGQTQTTAGWIAAGGGGVAALTRVIVGIRGDRKYHSHLIVVAIMLSIGSLSYLALAFVYDVIHLLIPAIALAYAAGWGWNGLFTLAITSKYPSQAAHVTGITSVGGRVGGVVGPFLFGAIVRVSSYNEAWMLTAAVAITGATIIFLTNRGLPR